MGLQVCLFAVQLWNTRVCFFVSCSRTLKVCCWVLSISCHGALLILRNRNHCGKQSGLSRAKKHENNPSECAKLLKEQPEMQGILLNPCLLTCPFFYMYISNFECQILQCILRWQALLSASRVLGKCKTHSAVAASVRQNWMPIIA